MPDAAASGRRLDGDPRANLPRRVLSADGSQVRPCPQRLPGRTPGTAEVAGAGQRGGAAP